MRRYSPSRDGSRRGSRAALRASAAARARPARCAAPSTRAAAPAAPSSAVEIRRTRQSSPASSKIASAKSAQVQSPSAATCQTPCGSSSTLARGRGEVADVGRGAALVVDDRDLVPLGAEAQHRAQEVVPGRAEEPRRAHDPGPLARRRLAVELRAAVAPTRVRAVRLDVRLALAAVEDVVGREVDERRAERGDVRACRRR